MIKIIKMMTIGLLNIIVLSGCTSKYSLTFDSNPRGALLICYGKNLGFTPYTIYIDKEKLKGLKSIPLNCYVKWISGATSSYSSSIPIDKFPNGVTAMAQRPNIAGYEKDIQFALQLQNMIYKERLIRALEQANRQRAIDSYNRSIQNMNMDLNWQNTNFQLQQLNNYLRYGY